MGVGSGTLLRASLISVIDRSLTVRATASWLRPPTVSGAVSRLTVRVRCSPRRTLASRMRRADSSTRARGTSPALTALTIAAAAAAESGESRMTSMPASTARTAASPGVAMRVIAAIFIESE